MGSGSTERSTEYQVVEAPIIRGSDDRTVAIFKEKTDEHQVRKDTLLNLDGKRLPRWVSDCGVPLKDPSSARM